MFNYTLLKDFIQQHDTVYQVTSNKEKFTKKPEQKTDAPRIQNNMYAREFTLKEIAEAFGSGQTLVLAHFGFGNVKAKEATFLKSRFIGLDFDHGGTISETLDFSKKKGFEPAIIYQSFSHTEEAHRFRFIYILDKEIEDAKEYKRLLAEFYKRFHDATPDGQTKSAARIWYGTNKNVWLNENAPRVNVSDFDTEEIEYKPIEYAITSHDGTIGEILEKHGKQIGELDNENWQPIVMGLAGACRTESYETFEAKMIASGAVSPSADALMRLKNMHANVQTLDLAYVISAVKRLFNSSIESKVLNFSKITWFNKNAIKLNDGEYVSDKKIFENVAFNKKTLVVAPAGAGKTTATMKAISQLVDGVAFKRAVFALPTKIAVEQIAKEAKSAGFRVVSQYEKGAAYAFQRGDFKIMVCTFNRVQSEQLDTEDTLMVIDEVHLLNDFDSFSSKVMTYMRKIITNHERTVICLTATPHALLPTLFDTKILYKKDFNKSVTVIELPRRRKNQLAEIKQIIERDLLANKKTLIYLNSKSKGEKLKKDLAVILPKCDVGLVNADNKRDNADFDEIIESASFSSQVVICTKLLNVAVSIKNTIGTMIAVNLYDITEIMQLINRERGSGNFALLFTENALRQKTSVQSKIDSYHQLTLEEEKRVIKHNAKSKEQAGISMTVSNRVISVHEEVRDVSIVWTLSVDEWLHKYNYHYKEIIKALDPLDIIAFLKSQGVSVSKNFSDSEDLKGDETEEEFIFEWKNTKQFFKKVTKQEVAEYAQNEEVNRAVEKHIINNVDKRERKRIRFVIDHFEIYDTLQEHNITNKEKLTTFETILKDAACGECSLPIFAPLIRSLASKEAIYFTSRDKKEIGLTIGKRNCSDADCLSVLRKLINIKRVQQRNGDKRFYQHFASATQFVNN